MILVDAKDNRDVLPLGGGGYDDLFRASLNVLGGAGSVAENAGAFYHDINAQIAPGQLSRISFGKGGDAVAIDNERVVSRLNSPFVYTVIRIIAKQVRHRIQITKIVKGCNVNVIGVTFQHGF